MANRFRVPIAIATVTVVAGLLVAVWPSAGQSTYRAPRLAGTANPDLAGIWQVLNTAYWDIQVHPMQLGPFANVHGTWGAQPAEEGVVEGNELPYRPQALAKKQENFKRRLEATPDNLNTVGDPEAKCYLPGVPRATYLPYPFQIIQSTKKIVIAYEFANANRTIVMDRPTEAPVDTWMGWSNGHWEGDTLVVDVTGFNDLTWFDRAGNFHSDALHVVERYTPLGPNHLQYEATIDDPKVFTRPWKMRMPLYRRLDRNQLFEFKCIEGVEEYLYGSLRKQPSR